VIELGENERLDDLELKGRRIIQNRAEFCFGIDAVLLAHFPRWHPRAKVLDLGTGSGVIPLIIADEVAHIEAIELNPALADLARRNIELNGLTDKINLRVGDLRRLREIAVRRDFDWVTANPPYWPKETGKLNQTVGQVMARHEITATLFDVIGAARHALKFGGRLAMIHLPGRLQEIMGALKAQNFAVKRLQLIQPQPGKPPNLALIEAKRGAKEGITFLPTLNIRDNNGEYTDEIKKIYGK